MAGTDDTLQLVTFLLGNERYGIDIMEVKEIFGYQEVRAIPNAPDYVEGIFNLRGDIIPIINLHRRFQIRRAELSEEDALMSGFIIIRLQGMLLGVIIDKVLRVTSVESDQVQPPPQVFSGIGTEYIRGVVQQEEGYLIILDIERLFDPEELQQIGQYA